MRSKILSTDHTMYPLDYDKNDKKGFHQWREYIHTELQNSILPTDGMVVEANKILTRDSRYKTPLTDKQKVNGDRVVYFVLVASAIAVAILMS